MSEVIKTYDVRKLPTVDQICKDIGNLDSTEVRLRYTNRKLPTLQLVYEPVIYRDNMEERKF